MGVVGTALIPQVLKTFGTDEGNHKTPELVYVTPQPWEVT